MNLLNFPLFRNSFAAMKLANGKITKLSAVPTIKLDSKPSENSTNDRTETKIINCKTAVSNALRKELKYGLRI